MRMAVVLSDLAVPPRTGLQEQSLLLLEGLANESVEVDLYAFAKAPVAAAMLPRHLAAPVMPMRLGWTLTGLALRLLGHSGLEERLGDYDVVYLEGAAAAGLLRRSWAGKAVVNLIDPGSRRRMRFAKAATGPLVKLKEVIAAGLSYVLEANLNHGAATWVVVSESDRDYLRGAHNHLSTAAIPVMLPQLPTPTTHDPAGSVVVTIYADLREPHMLRSFVDVAKSVLAPACAAEPALAVRVLGRLAPSPELLATLPGLPMTFAGWSEDHLGELQRSDIVILPDTVGTGIKNRAVQCLGIGRAIVGTDVVFEGIGVRHGEEAFVASDAAEMLEAVLALARSEQLRTRMGCNARMFALEHYGRERVMDMWMTLFRSRAAAR